MMCMSLYLELIKKNDTLEAVRSLWSKTGLSWKFMENGFLYIELVLRFIPTIRFEWNKMLNSHKSLGRSSKMTKWKAGLVYVNYLPGIIVQSYRKSEEVAGVMLMRGYGKQYPRGVAYPIVMRWSDIVFGIIFTIILIGMNYIA